MAKVGRPRGFSDEEVVRILANFERYIAKTEIPIVKEFAYQNEIPHDILYDYPEFSNLKKRCLAKKESQLERLSLEGKINGTQAIFSLKQLGWTDKQQVEHSGGVEVHFDKEDEGLL